LKAVAVPADNTKEGKIVMMLEEHSLDYVQRLQQVLKTTLADTTGVQHGEKPISSRWVSFSTFWLK